MVIEQWGRMQKVSNLFDLGNLWSFFSCFFLSLFSSPSRTMVANLMVNVVLIPPARSCAIIGILWFVFCLFVGLRICWSANVFTGKEQISIKFNLVLISAFLFLWHIYVGLDLEGVRPAPNDLSLSFSALTLLVEPPGL